MVSMPSRRVSSCPVPIGNVRQSTMMSSTRMPHFSTRSRIVRSATRTFQSAVRAWPSSSMHITTTAAPCSLMIGIDPGEPRVGAVAVLVVDRVDHAAPAEHLQPGLDHLRARWSRASAAAWTRWRTGRRSPACRRCRRGRRSRCRRPACASRRGSGSRAIATQSSQRPSSMASRNALEPLALVRSPIMRHARVLPERDGLVERGRARPPVRALRRTGSTSRTASTTWRRCSGVVPQQPPTRRGPYSRTNAVMRARPAPAG